MSAASNDRPQKNNVPWRTLFFVALGFIVVVLALNFEATLNAFQAIFCFDKACKKDIIQQQLDIQNLLSQRNLVVTSWIMVLITVGSVFVGLRSLFYIRESLDASKATVATADASVKTAQKSLKHQIDTSKIQNKCYPLVNSVEFRHDASRPSLAISITNSGATPVLSARVEVKVAFTHKGAELPVTRSVENMASVPDMAAGSSEIILVALNYTLSSQELTEMRTGSLYVTVSGKLIYSSVFGAETPYEFSYECSPTDLLSYCIMTRDISHTLPNPPPAHGPKSDLSA